MELTLIPFVVQMGRVSSQSCRNAFVIGCHITSYCPTLHGFIAADNVARGFPQYNSYTVRHQVFLARSYGRTRVLYRYEFIQPLAVQSNDPAANDRRQDSNPVIMTGRPGIVTADGNDREKRKLFRYAKRHRQ